MNSSGLSRRAFVGTLPLTVFLDPSPLGASCFQECACARDDADAGAPRDRIRPQEASLPGFHREFTAEEAEKVAASPMAREIAALQGQGYSCAEMSLLAALRFLGLPEEHLGSAGVFGGGVGKQDLCGFLTGNLMAFGLAASARIPDRAERRRVGRALSNEYWDWWLTRGDIHCAILRPTYNGAEEFVRVGQRAALKAEELLRTHLPP
jgi:hypothetical protein